MIMKRILIAGAILAAGVAIVAPARAQMQQAAAPGAPGGPSLLALTSPSFEDGGVIPGKFTQSVDKYVSPTLKWTNVPAGTVSFALIMHDPDVAIDKKTGDVLHWMAFNIPGTATGLPEAVPPDPTLSDGTIQAKNRGGVPGYRGPGAPAGGPYHHYTLELFALDTKLSLGPDATRQDVLAAMDGHILAKAVLVGRFHK